MPLEDALAALTAAVTENNRLLGGIASTAAARRESAGGAPPAPAAGAPPAADPPPARRRGRQPRDPAAGGTAGGPTTYLPPDPPDFTIDSFKKYVGAWLLQDAKDEATQKEHERRLPFVVSICELLEIDKSSDCEPEDRPIIVGLLKQFLTNPNVDIEAAFPPAGGDGGQKKSYV